MEVITYGLVNRIYTGYSYQLLIAKTPKLSQFRGFQVFCGDGDSRTLYIIRYHILSKRLF